MKPLALLVLALVLFGGGLSAQEQGVPVRPFTRVRVHAPALAAKPLVGNFVLVDADSLVLARGASTARLVLPAGAVHRLDISRGRSRLLGAVTGAGIGGVAGGLTLAGLVAMQEGIDEWALLGFIIGASYGAPLGAAVGAVVGVERWEAHPQWKVGVRASL